LTVRPPRWALLVFAAALLARLAFVFLADEPLLWTHQYIYFTNALAIAEHAHPLQYSLTSEEWRTWDRHWTIAPLYYLFAATVLKLSGSSLLALRFVQCLLDAAAAVGVAWMGRRVAGRHGAWAGLAYALHWPAIEMPSWTMTENLHTPLLVLGVCLLAREAESPSRKRALLGGIAVGLSALVRSVSTGFLGLATLSRLWPERRRALPFAALVLAGGLLTILPWTARNVFIIGDPILIESTAFENIWFANHFTDKAHYRNQEEVVHSQPTPGAKRMAALHFAIRGITRHPGMMVVKSWSFFWHLLRPEGLHNLLAAHRTLEPWRYAGLLLLDDVPLLITVPLFLVFLVAAPDSPTRRLITLWTAYYVFMIVVVFHNEIRYRSALAPFAFAGAAGGLATLVQAMGTRRTLARATLALGVVLSVASAWPYAGAAMQALRARPTTLSDALARSSPGNAEPVFAYAGALARSGRRDEAIAAYQAGVPLASPADWSATLALPSLLAASGRTDDAAVALRDANLLSWDNDPWLALEIAWREVPPPVANELNLAQGDYGAVRGFLHPRGLDPALTRHRLEWTRWEDGPGPYPPPGSHRWTRHRAWLRLIPADAATAHDVTLEMGSPFPSPVASPQVRVRVGDAAPVVVTLSPEIRPYVFRAQTPPGKPVIVEITAPTWSRAGEPADQGVRVDAMRLSAVPGS
jgi:4-amino-4-deoxy-L-arabinose transferase-like glycosyltransferase